MGLGNLRKRGISNRGQVATLCLEQLENRDLLAVFLPDTFAQAEAQPVGLAFNGGEQAFFNGHSGDLRFEFGQSTLSTTYTGSNWNAVDVNNLLQSAVDTPIGNPKLYVGLGDINNPITFNKPEMHAVYRAAGGKIIDIQSSYPWAAKELVAGDAVSDPEVATLNGGRQVLYIDTAGRVHFVGSADNGVTWSDTDLTALVGEDVNPEAKAVPTSGVAAIQVGGFEHYVYHRADGALGNFRWTGAAWDYFVLNDSDLPGFIAPINGATGALESISYSTSGATTPNVGWVLFKDGAGDLRGVWLTQSGWRSAVLTNVRTASAPSAAYDPVARKLSVAYYDANSHLRLLQEGSPWTNKDYHASSVLNMPLGNLGEADTPATAAAATIVLADVSTITVTAAQGGTFYNGVTIDISGGLSSPESNAASASYDSSTKTLTVLTIGNPAKTQIATAINDLAEFNATAGGGGAGFDAAIDGFGTFATLSGATDVVPGTAAKPDIYWRSYASGGIAPSLQILYKDMSNHVHNVRPTSSFLPTVFDTTAFLEGYHNVFGYGVVNAARAVAYAIGSQTFTTGAALNNWNLDRIKAPDAWSMATGQNAAVFVLDSGVDVNNVDLNTLSGRNIVAQTTNVADSNGHGTGVAGIIAAKNNAGGIIGVAFDARVVPVKLGDGSPASGEAIVSGIDYAMNYTLPAGYATATRVVNLSLASSQSVNIESVLPNVRNKMYVESPDAVFVLAAGNRTQAKSDYPAAFAVGFGIIAGAINISGQRWAPTNSTTNALTPSNYLLAPGVSVPASALVGTSGDNHNFGEVTGTSAAAAHISGVIALMLDANPALNPREVEDILIASADQTVTQTVAASAPSIPATIYWASAPDPSPAAFLALTPSSSSPVVTTPPQSDQALATVTTTSSSTTASIPLADDAVDAVFETLAAVDEPDDSVQLPASLASFLSNVV